MSSGVGGPLSNQTWISRTRKGYRDCAGPGLGSMDLRSVENAEPTAVSVVCCGVWGASMGPIDR